jgi:hypothetical protein
VREKWRKHLDETEKGQHERESPERGPVSRAMLVGDGTLKLEIKSGEQEGDNIRPDEPMPHGIMGKPRG